MKRIVFIFGNPSNGKSHLAKMFGDHGYSVLSLDMVYLNFIQEKYPTLYLPDLALIISQHYKMVLSDGGRKTWEKYAISISKNFIKDKQNVVIEGYLLEPILGEFRAKLSDHADVTVVEVRDGEYYILGEIDWSAI